MVIGLAAIAGDAYATANIHFESSTSSGYPDGNGYQYHVYRDADSSGPIDVSYSVSSSDMASGTDYVVRSGPLHWNDGEMGSKPVIIAYSTASTLQGNKQLTITLTGVSENATITQGTCAVTVIYPTLAPTPSPTPAPAPTLRFDSSEKTGSEGSTLTFTITREGADLSGTSKVSIIYGSDSETGCAGFGGPNGDFVYGPGDLTFGPGESSKTITANIFTDSKVEPTEHVILMLNNPSGATLGTPSNCKIWITDVPPAATPSPSASPSVTPSPTVSPSPSGAPSVTPSAAPSPSSSPSAAPTSSSGTGSPSTDSNPVNTSVSNSGSTTVNDSTGISGSPANSSTGQTVNQTKPANATSTHGISGVGGTVATGELNDSADSAGGEDTGKAAGQSAGSGYLTYGFLAIFGLIVMGVLAYFFVVKR